MNFYIGQEVVCVKSHSLGYVTKDKSYIIQYIKAISVSPEATEIKLRDLEHNSQITRIKGLRRKDLERIEKYHRAYIYLKN